MTGRRSLWAAPIAGAVLFVLTLGLLWHPVVADVARGHSVNDIAKDFVLADQLSYMVMARNSADGQSVYREPFTETGSSIYASAHMWFVGRFGSALGLSPIGAWNVAGLVLSALLLAAFGAWGHWATGSAWGWLGASVPVLVGLLGPGWSVTFAGHSHAVLWPAYAILYAAGPETPALLLGFMAVLLTGWAVRPHPGRLVASVAAGLAAGVCLLLHTYVAMFAVTTCAAIQLLSGTRSQGGRERWRIPASVGAVTTLAFLALPAAQPVGRLAVVVVAALAAASILAREADGWRVPIAFAAGAAVGAGPQLARVAAAALRGDEFLRFRQQASADLSLPPSAVLVFCAPVFILAVCSLLWPVDQAGRYPGRYRDVTAGVLAAGLLLTFNNAWGLHQEPYRFLPYTTLFLTVAAIPWLVGPAGPGRRHVARLACIGLLIFTVPSTLRFAGDVKDQTARFAAAERELYVMIAANAPPGTLVLVDACITPAVFKLATGAAVVGYNAGIAFPAEVGAIQSILDDQLAGRVPPVSDLRRAGVGLVVKQLACERTGSTSAYTTAFGPPTAIAANGSLFLFPIT